MNPFVRIITLPFRLIAKLIRFIRRLFKEEDAPEINSPTEGQCVTWGANGTVTINVTTVSPLPPGTYVYTASFIGGGVSTPINSDYGNPMVITAAQHGSPAACKTMEICIVKVVGTTRTTVAVRRVQLCPTCPDPTPGEG